MNTGTANGRGGVGRTGLGVAASRIFPIVVFAILPTLALVLTLHATLDNPSQKFAFWDFRALWEAGRAVIHGHNPYPRPDSSALRGEQAFVYPAPAALLAVPFAALPFKAGGLLFVAFGTGALLLALRIAGVRDWRCYGVAALSEPAISALALGTLTPFLVLAVAVVWRYRDRTGIVASAVTAAIVLKVFLWPLLFWLLFTRRTRAAVISAVSGAAITLVAWAAIGFAGLREYPDLLNVLSRLLEGKGYSLVALGLSLGTGATGARALALTVGAAGLVAIGVWGRRPGAELWTIAIAIAASLAFTPIVWMHYFLLLFVPLAIAFPRLGWPWFAPLLFWVVGGQSDATLWQHPHWQNIAESARIGRPWIVIYGLVLATFLLVLPARAEPSG
jgi:hypothetical protein